MQIILMVFAYLLGSISSAILLCRLAGYPDPRSEGSKNPGATNVMRVANKKIAALTLLGDGLKGFLPVCLASVMHVPPFYLALIGAAAFFGHLFPIFFGFRGGKGVATYLGVLLGLNVLVAAYALAIWLLMAMIFRYSSLAALTALSLAPVCEYLLGDSSAAIVLAMMSVFILYCHRSNIVNLYQGREDKIK